MPGPVSDSFRGPTDNTPFVPTWMEPRPLRDEIADEVLRGIPIDDCGYTGDWALGLADRIIALLAKGVA